MPVTGHWHMRARAADYLEPRSQEIDRAEPAVVVLEAARAVAEWKRLEPPAIGHRAPGSCTSSSGAPAPAWRPWTPTPAARPPVLGRPTRRDRARRGGEPRGARAGGARRRSTAWPRRSEPETLRGLLRERQLVAAAPPPQARLPRLVAELGDVERPLPGLDRYLPTRPPHLSVGRMAAAIVRSMGEPRSKPAASCSPSSSWWSPPGCCSSSCSASSPRWPGSLSW